MTDTAWIDRNEYPFASHYFQTAAGRMHYVDEGSGEVVVMLHGNPACSFLYRKLINQLSPHYRCIAPDYIGFGLSDKPFDWSYLPEEQARQLPHSSPRRSLMTDRYFSRQTFAFLSALAKNNERE